MVRECTIGYNVDKDCHPYECIYGSTDGLINMTCDASFRTTMQFKEFGIKDNITKQKEKI